MTVLLEIDAVSRAFRGLRAVDRVSLAIKQGEIVGLIGPNGAGKTTLVNVITGVHPATEGTVRFAGTDITRLRPNRIARLGISRTFQIVQPFPRMTVADNIAAGALFAGGAHSMKEAAERAQVLARRVGAQVNLRLREDPELIGGLIVRLGDLLLDGSVRTQLENLGASLRKGTA